jgi:hypothetical protein
MVIYFYSFTLINKLLKIKSMRKETKKFPIYAGMQFGSNDNRIYKVGYYVMEFIYSHDNALLSQKEIKRIFY